MIIKEEKKAKAALEPSQEEDCKMEDKEEEKEEDVEITETEAKEALKRLKDFAELMVKGE